jgi:hypothetical protein
LLDEDTGDLQKLQNFSHFSSSCKAILSFSYFLSWVDLNCNTIGSVGSDMLSLYPKRTDKNRRIEKERLIGSFKDGGKQGSVEEK